MKTTDYILIIITILALLFVGYIGYRIYPAVNPRPEIKTDTIYISDTIVHSIPDTIPYYISHTDSVVIRDTVFKDVDTAMILKDYFACHYYTRTWKDTLIDVTIKDAVSRNKFEESTFNYQLLKPMTVIKNVTNNYSRYLTLGAGLPLKEIVHLNLDLDLRYVTKKFYVGVGYNAVQNCPVILGGVTLRQW